MNEAKLESIKQDVERDHDLDPFEIETREAEAIATKTVSPADAHDLEIAEALTRGKAAQLQADNSIAPPRLTRHAMMSLTLKQNPDLRMSMSIFQEAFIFNALQQEGRSLRGLANFTGLSKGLVLKHIANIQLKIDASKMREASDSARDQIEKAITDYDPKTETQSPSDNPTA